MVAGFPTMLITLRPRDKSPVTGVGEGKQSTEEDLILVHLVREQSCLIYRCFANDNPREVDTYYH
jgi:hypothetical protein